MGYDIISPPYPIPCYIQPTKHDLYKGRSASKTKISMSFTKMKCPKANHGKHQLSPLEITLWFIVEKLVCLGPLAFFVWDAVGVSVDN